MTYWTIGKPITERLSELRQRLSDLEWTDKLNTREATAIASEIASLTRYQDQGLSHEPNF